jgi:DNA-binding CsgD family transcriptional regulator
MDQDDPVTLLATLSAQERKVLELRCQGRLIKQIAQQLVVSENTVKTHLFRIYDKLHIYDRTSKKETDRIIRETFCPLLAQIRDLPPAADAPPAEDEPVPSYALALFEDNEEEDSTPLPGEQIIHLPSPAPEAPTESGTPNSGPGRLPACVLLGLGALIGACLIAGIGFLAFRMGLFSALSPSQVITKVVSCTPSPTLTAAVELIATVQATQTSPLHTLTAPPIQPPPIPPTTTALLPDTSTPPPTPAIPTSTNAPSTTSANVLFADNFDAGLNPAWKTVLGQPISADGKLASHSREIWLALDNNWDNYQVSFDALTNTSGTDFFEAFSPRFVDPNNLVGFSIANDRTYWYYRQQGKVTRVDATFRDAGMDITSHVILTVRGDAFEVEINGTKRGSVIDTQIPGGQLAIHLYKGAWIDNFVITKLQK